MTNLDNFYQKLQSYLSLHNVEAQYGTNSKCPIKSHKSKAPFIMNIGESARPVWYCHACSVGGSIFELAAFLYQLPFPRESGFYDITLQHLSDMLGEPMPVKTTQTLTPQEQERKSLYNATREVCNALTLNKNVLSYTSSRGWDTKTLKTFGVGVISDFKTLKSNLQARYSDSVLKAIGIISKGYYKTFLEEDRLLFPLHDYLGRPVGFTGRLIQHTKETPRKYVNTASSLIFKKSSVLYNLHRVNHSVRKDKKDLLYLVEGQADVLTLYQAGLRNVVAVSGVAFTDKHIELISDFDNVIACFDNDDGGFSATRKLYSKYKLATGKDLFLIKLSKFKDPDEYVKNEGLLSFQNLPTFLPIEWEILNTNIHNEVAAEHWLRKLLNENSIYYDRILTILSNKTSVSITSLKHRLSQLSMEYLLKQIGSLNTEKLNLNITITKERLQT